MGERGHSYKTLLAVVRRLRTSVDRGEIGHEEAKEILLGIYEDYEELEEEERAEDDFLITLFFPELG